MNRNSEVWEEHKLARGEGVRDSEEKGFQELTAIKDTWTKPRGRVEAREGGAFGWGGGKEGRKCRQRD